MSAGWDLNLHPSQSRRVPLPLNHLALYALSLLNSYPRALNVQSMTLTTLLMHLMYYLMCDNG